MKGGNPLLLGQIAVHEELVTSEQLEELIEIQRQRLDPIAADATGEDLRRHLDGEPIQARPVGVLERIGRRRDAVGDLERALELAPGRKGALEASLRASRTP